MRIMKALMLVAAMAGIAAAQNQPESGSITTAIAGPGNCVIIRAQNNSSVGFVLTGTWSGTLQPSIYISPARTVNKKVQQVDTNTIFATLTSNGSPNAYVVNVGGFAVFQLCASAWSSGTAVVDIFSTPAPNNATIATGGAGTVTGLGNGTGITIGGTSSVPVPNLNVALPSDETAATPDTGSAAGLVANDDFVNAEIIASITNGTRCGPVWGTLFWYCDVYGAFNTAGDMTQATAAALSAAIGDGAGWVDLDARGYSNLSPVNASVNAFAALVPTGYQPIITGKWQLPCAYVQASAIQTTASFSILGCASKFNGGSASTQGTDWVLTSGVKHAATFAASTAATVGGQATQAVFQLTQATVSGGSVIYTGAIPGGGSNAFAGDYFTITGFANAGNNGNGIPLVATASTTGALTLTNAAGVNETHWGLASSTYSFTSTPTSTQVSNVQPYEMYVQCTTGVLGETGTLCGGSTATTQARGLVTSVTASGIQVQTPVSIGGINANTTYAVTYPCAFVVGDLSGTTASGGFAGFGTELAYMQIDLAQNSVTGAEGICIYNASNLTRVHDITGLPYGNFFLDISSNQAQNMMGPWNFWVTDGGNTTPTSACAISSMTAAIGNWHDFSCALGGSGTNQYFVFDALGDYGPEFHIISQPPATGTTVGIDLGNATTVPIVRYSTPGNVSGSDVSYINATASGGNAMNELVRIGNASAATNVHIHNLASKGVNGTIANMLVDSNQTGTCSIAYSDSGSTLGDYWIDGAGKSRSNITGLSPACNAATVQSQGFTLLGATSGTCPLTVSATGGTLNICSASFTVTTGGAATAASLALATGAAMTTVGWNNTATAHNIGLYEGANTAQNLLSCAAGAVLQGSATDPTCTATPTLGGVGLGTGTTTYAGNTSGTATFGCAGAACSTLSTASPIQAKSYGTAANCSSSASPAVCAAASSGSVALPTGTNPTLVVNTTAVTASSQILLEVDESLGTKLSVTCNTTLSTLVNPVVTARTSGTSFTFTIGAIIATNPACVSYTIIN